MKIKSLLFAFLMFEVFMSPESWAQAMRFPSPNKPPSNPSTAPTNTTMGGATNSIHSTPGASVPPLSTSSPSPSTLAPTQPQPTLATPSNDRVELDPNAKLILNEEQISSVFRDMVVVQRKAKDKAQKFLIAPSVSFEFSDGPKAMYPVNLDLGYSINDFWEIYLNYVPSFLIKNRSIVDKVSQLRTSDGKIASIDASNPKSQVGVNVLWVPAYGKDSWGPYRIVRSDTFFKFGFSSVVYDAGSGNRLNAMVGKTYFLSKYLNFRLALGYMNIESYSVSNGSAPQKSADTVIIMESGLVFYF